MKRKLINCDGSKSLLNLIVNSNDEEIDIRRLISFL